MRASGARVLPNTAGCRTAKEAIVTAQMAREVFQTDWIKLEVIPDPRNLLPDPIGTLEAAARADESRDIGNYLHFCRWRQIERLILLLSAESAIGTVH